jgi:GTP-binding protein
MFVDKVKVSVQAGDGGDGAVSFRHEKFVDRGGPDGGDGGDGGDVLLIASRNQNTLATFRYQKELKAAPGKTGLKRRKHGKSGDDLEVAVPVGTQAIDETGNVLADLTEDQQRAVIAEGGKGGFGNAHFVSSTRQAPRVAEKGEPGQKLELTLELKMIADVGLVGLPNAGKSTFLARVSNARPEIADYPFTTIRPNLGVVDIDKQASLLFADIPGLIEGASQGKGLGDEFLRHVERTAVLVHLIDAYQNDVTEAYQTIQKELKAYQVDLTTRPQIVALNKIDGLDEDIVGDLMAELRVVVPPENPVHAISALSGQGVQELLYAVKDAVQAERSRSQTKQADEDAIPILRLPEDQADWYITHTEDGYEVTGGKIERFARRTDFDSNDGVQRLRDIMKKMGIMQELSRKGAQPGEKIKIGPNSIEM